jgi:integrase
LSAASDCRPSATYSGIATSAAHVNTDAGRSGANCQYAGGGIGLVANTGFAAAPADHARIGRSALNERITLGELLRLRLDDVDVQAGVLRIRESKFHKSRLVPLSPSALTELRNYLEIRNRRAQSRWPLSTRP